MQKIQSLRGQKSGRQDKKKSLKGTIVLFQVMVTVRKKIRKVVEM